MVIHNVFDLGQIVYLKTDVEQKRRIVTRTFISQTGIMYDLGCGNNDSIHYECEISAEVNILVKTDG